MLPQISPSPLTSVKEPIGHPNWVYELKHDGFRGILYVDREQAWLVSRKGKKFRRFDPLLKQVLGCLKGQRAILDGEIVVLDEKGRSNFYDLMAHRGEPRYYAFDLLWLNGIDLRSRPLLDRKRRPRGNDSITTQGNSILRFLLVKEWTTHKCEIRSARRTARTSPWCESNTE